MESHIWKEKLSGNEMQLYKCWEIIETHMKWGFLKCKVYEWNELPKKFMKIKQSYVIERISEGECVKLHARIFVESRALDCS